MPTADDEGTRIPVSLHLLTRLTARRSERRRTLLEHFRRINALFDEIDIDYSSLAISGQTVDATIPAGTLVELADKLADHDTRVDRLEDRDARA